jgi:uncharacterized protein YjiK
LPVQKYLIVKSIFFSHSNTHTCPWTSPNGKIKNQIDHVLIDKRWHSIMRAVCKVCGLMLLLQVRTLWRCSDGLFFKESPLASDALLTTHHLLLKNVIIVILKEPFLGWQSNLSGASVLYN